MGITCLYTNCLCRKAFSVISSSCAPQTEVFPLGTDSDSWQYHIRDTGCDQRRGTDVIYRQRTRATAAGTCAGKRPRGKGSPTWLEQHRKQTSRSRNQKPPCLLIWVRLRAERRECENKRGTKMELKERQNKRELRGIWDNYFYKCWNFGSERQDLDKLGRRGHEKWLLVL